MRKTRLMLLILVLTLVLSASPATALVCPSTTLCAQRLNSCLQNALNTAAGAELETAAARCIAQYETCTSPEWCLPVY